MKICVNTALMVILAFGITSYSKPSFAIEPTTYVAIAASVLSYFKDDYDPSAELATENIRLSTNILESISTMNKVLAHIVVKNDELKEHIDKATEEILIRIYVKDVVIGMQGYTELSRSIPKGKDLNSPSLSALKQPFGNTLQKIQQTRQFLVAKTTPQDFLSSMIVASAQPFELETMTMTVSPPDYFISVLGEYEKYYTRALDINEKGTINHSLAADLLSKNKLNKVFIESEIGKLTNKSGATKMFCFKHSYEKPCDSKPCSNSYGQTRYYYSLKHGTTNEYIDKGLINIQKDTNSDSVLNESGKFSIKQYILEVSDSSLKNQKLVPGYPACSTYSKAVMSSAVNELESAVKASQTINLLSRKIHAGIEVLKVVEKQLEYTSIYLDWKCKEVPEDSSEASKLFCS